jgi:hypothetical protein
MNQIQGKFIKELDVSISPEQFISGKFIKETGGVF